MAVLNLAGQALATVRILLIVVPAFLMYGYNQSSLGGVLAFKSFTQTFPRIDTVNTKGSQQADNARVQGKTLHHHGMPSILPLIRLL